MNNIQIFEITLQDYRQYYGETTIPLATDEGRNINVIEGQNGAGKSNILNAITLCFYGEETHTSAQSGDALETDPYVTKRKLEELEPGESTVGHIEITLGKDEPKYAFQRSFTTARVEDDSSSGEPEYSNSIGDLSLMQRFGGNDWQPISRPENVLREILPNHVYQYFFFDGEQLDEFFEQGYSNRVKNAVLDVSHVELLNNAIDHLEEVQREYERSSTDLGGNIEELQNKKEQAEDELDRLEVRRDELQAELEKAQGRVEEINEKLSTSGDENVRELQKRRESLNSKIEVWENELKDKKVEIGTTLCQFGSIAYNEDTLSYAVSALAEHESEEGGLPGLTEELVDHLLSRGECLCGEPFADGDEVQRHLQKLHDDVASNGSDVIDGRLRMNRTLTSGEELLDTLLDEKADVERLRTNISEKADELGRISDKLEDVDKIDSDRAAELEENRKRISTRIGEMNRELGELNTQIKQQEQTVKDRKRQWRDALEKQDKNRLLVEKTVFMNESVMTLEDIKEDILNQVRSQTESRLEQYFNDLIWKDENYDITLTEDYEVRLYNQDGRKNLGSLAAGERQVLALAFMASLSKISGFNAPIVIDTPLGRISSDPKQLIAQNVPNYLEDTQVTLLMTDVEYSEDVRAFIESDVTNEYHLHYHDGITEVREL